MSNSTTLSLVMIAASLGAIAPACKTTGMGSAVRADVSAQMQTAQTPITSCYATALTSNRKLKGFMMLEFTAEPSTGKFINAAVVRDELNDTSMKTCVLAEVAKLKLAKPQSTKVLVSYPLRFAPTK
jgi:hypothetical protein